MFGYKYGISKDNEGNKILDISVNLEYISKCSNYSDEWDVDNIEEILSRCNPIGIIKEYVEKEFENKWR